MNRDINYSLLVVVLVTGAAGRTGALTLRKLLGLPSVEVKGLVRNAKSAKKLKKAVPSSSDKDIVFADIIESSESLDKAFQGVDAVILATSAVPKIKILSILKVLILKLFRKTARPEFTFPKNGQLPLRDQSNFDSNYASML